MALGFAGGGRAVAAFGEFGLVDGSLPPPAAAGFSLQRNVLFFNDIAWLAYFAVLRVRGEGSEQELEQEITEAVLGHGGIVAPAAGS
jgi:hypothetical protein